MNLYKTVSIIGFLTFSLLIKGQKTQTSYFKDSKIKSSEWEYIEGNKAKVSNIKERDSKTGVLTGHSASGTTFTQKIPHGKWTDFFENGKVKNIFHYENGYKNGIAKSYYEDGKIKAEYNYQDNMLFGSCKIYYPNGKLYEESEYQEKSLRKYALIYNENGVLFKKYQFEKWDTKNGYQSGHYTEYYPSGQAKEVGTFNLNNIDWQNIDKVSSFNPEILEQEHKYNESGKLIYDYNTSTGKIISFHSNENKHLEGNMLNGFYKEYYENGKLNQFVHVKDGLPFGFYEGYYENGQLKDKGEYKSEIINGNPKYIMVGKWEYYFKDGKKKKIEIHSNESLILSEWNQNGQLIKEYKYIPNPEKKILKAELDKLVAEKEMYLKQDNKQKAYEIEFNIDSKKDIRSTMKDSVYIQLEYSDNSISKATIDEKKYSSAEYSIYIQNNEQKVISFQEKETEFKNTKVETEPEQEQESLPKLNNKKGKLER